MRLDFAAKETAREDTPQATIFAIRQVPHFGSHEEIDERVSDDDIDEEIDGSDRRE